MRKTQWLGVLISLVGTLSFVPAGIADASSLPPVIMPRMIAVSSAALCTTPTCIVTATVTYNTAVGVTNNAALDFTMKDVTQGAACVVTSVTSSPPPSPVVPPVPANSLYVRANCANVASGDTMSLLYHLSPSTTAGYVYNLSDPTVHALVPNGIKWIEGLTLA
jgi:hypothetical protein